MSSDVIDQFQAGIERHRLLSGAGVASILAGGLVGAWVGYEWFAHGTSHVVIAFVAGVALILGIQFLVFSFMASMLITLHEEQRAYLGED